jgi:hypothetical protein
LINLKEEIFMAKVQKIDVKNVDYIIFKTLSKRGRKPKTSSSLTTPKRTGVKSNKRRSGVGRPKGSKDSYKRSRKSGIIYNKKTSTKKSGRGRPVGSKNKKKRKTSSSYRIVEPDSFAR